MWTVQHMNTISDVIVNTVEAMYKKADSKVLINSEVSNELKTNVGVRHGCFCLQHFACPPRIHRYRITKEEEETIYDSCIHDIEESKIY